MSSPVKHQVNRGLMCLDIMAICNNMWFFDVVENKLCPSSAKWFAIVCCNTHIAKAESLNSSADATGKVTSSLCSFIKDSILQFNFSIIAICWWIWIELFMCFCHRAKRTGPNDLTSQALPLSLGPFFCLTNIDSLFKYLYLTSTLWVL